MNVTAISLLVTACVFAGGVFGLQLHRWLPEHHLTRETQDVVRLGTGMVSVLASLLFGLLIATAKSASDTTDREMRSYATDLILLDRTLRSYGEGAASPRALLRRSTARTIQDIWPMPGGHVVGLDDVSAGRMLEQVQEAIRAMNPVGAEQRSIRDQALQTATSLLRQRWILIEQAGHSVRPVVLFVLVSWTVAIFISFGLNAPRNATVAGAFLMCSFAIGGAVFLILEMDSPFEGMLRLAAQPMLNALAQMDP
jgi:hypothetical protein